MGATKLDRSLAVLGAPLLLITLLVTGPGAVRGQDICSLPADIGPCDGACPRWFFNADTLRCEAFTWGCCGGNANNFKTPLACQASCACELPPDPGPCDGICPRWFFNAETGECEEFIWGCCEGNANNFETLEACEAACADPCAGDVTIDGTVDVADLVEVIITWGMAGGAADLNHDGAVDVQDLVLVVIHWGPCA